MKKILLVSLMVMVLLPLTGCWLFPKKAEMTLSIIPSITRINTYQTLEFTLKETNNIGVNLNRLEYRMWDKWGNLWHEKIYTGTEAKTQYQELFGTAYLAGDRTLRVIFEDYWEAGPEGKREYVMSGKDNNGNSVKAGDEYWARS